MIRKHIAGHRADVACAAGLGVVTLALYVATLQPGLGGPEDTPKFQFLGYVLGTAHPPGYPLYSLLSHVFVTLVPFGSVAFRANLFSAVTAASACALAFLVARAIGAGRFPAVVATFALGTGLNFWRNAVFAEVYGLAAATTGAIAVLLLAWQRSRTTWMLLAAVTAVGVAAGNHLIVLGLVPAAVTFVLLVDRTVVTLRFLVTGAVLLVLSLSQYVFIVLRTRQGAPYLESVAWSISDLYAVVTAKRFAASRFAFTPHDLLFNQLPATARAVGEDLGIVGTILLIVGLSRAVIGRSPDALLVAGAAAGMVAFIINLSGDVGGFITPLLVLLWPLCGLGLETVAGACRSLRLLLGVEGWRRPSGRGTLEAGVGSLLLMAVSLVVVTRSVSSYAASDQSRNVEDEKFYRTLYTQLPPRSAVVAENYTLDMAFQYLMFTAEAGPDKEMRRLAFSGREVGDARREGRRVFALHDAATFFGAEGFRFEPTSIGTSLDVWLGGLPAGTLVLGASANAAFPFEVLGRLQVTPRAAGRGRPHTAFALVGGRPEAKWIVEDTPISLLIDEGLLHARLPRLPATLVVSSDADGARIALGQRTIASVPNGVVIAAFDPSGKMLASLGFGPGDPLTVPLEPRVFEYKGEAACAALLPGAWTDISAVSMVSGTWMTTLTELGTVRLETEVEGDGGLSVTELMGGGHARIVEPVQTSAATRTFTTDMTRTRTRRVLFRTAVDAGPRRARVRLLDGKPMRICAHIPPAFIQRAGAHTSIGVTAAADAYFGHGWSRPEHADGGAVRRGAAPSTILLPLAPATAYRIWLDAVAAAGLWFAIEMNGTVVAECEFNGRQPCVVDVAATQVRQGVSVLAMRLARPSADESNVSIVLRGLQLVARE